MDIQRNNYSPEKKYTANESKYKTMKMDNIKFADSAEKPKTHYVYHSKKVSEIENHIIEITPEKKSSTKRNGNEHYAPSNNETRTYGNFQSDQKDTCKKVIEYHDPFNNRNSVVMEAGYADDAKNLKLTSRELIFFFNF